MASKIERICDLCESETEVNWTCQECDQLLCNTCKKIHLRAKTCKNHHVLPLDGNLQNSGNLPVRGNTDEEYCQQHPSEKFQRYCKNCDTPLCIECVFSHHGHTLIKLSEILVDKQRELSDIIKQTENNRVSKIKKSLKEMKENKEKYITETNNSIEEIKKKAETLKAGVDKMQDNFIQETKSRQQNQTREFDSCIKRLEKELSNMQQKIKEAGNKLATTREINALNKEIKNMKTIMENKRKITQPSVKSIQFTANKSNLKDLQKLFGYLSLETDHSENDDDDDDKLASDIIREVAISPVQNFTHGHFVKDYYCYDHDKQLLNNPTEISHICCYGDRALIISQFQNDKIFSDFNTEFKRYTGCGSYHKCYAFRPYFAIIKQVSFNGKVQTERKWETQVIHGMVTYEDSIFISDEENKQILLSKDGQLNFKVFVTTKPYTPYNLCCTGRGHLLACLIESDSKRIVHYTKTARVAQVFELNDKGQPLLKNPTTITVNKHENIWIQDSGTIMVLDFKGSIKFTYDGLNGPNKADLLKKHQLDHKFSPHGMACNEYGDVLICDYENSVIHVVDSTGSTVDLIKSEKPRCITNDSRNKCLWIATDERKVSVVKYSMN